MARFTVDCLRPRCGESLQTHSAAELADWSRTHDDTCVALHGPTVDPVPLLEDEDGAPYPDDVQDAHALTLAPWLAACDAVGVPHDPDALVTHHRGNAALAAVCAATADQLADATRRGTVAALTEYAAHLEARPDYRDHNEAIVMREHARRVEAGRAAL